MQKVEHRNAGFDVETFSSHLLYQSEFFIFILVYSELRVTKHSQGNKRVRILKKYSNIPIALNTNSFFANIIENAIGQKCAVEN